MPKLKPCPFCGETTNITVVEGPLGIAGECYECLATGPWATGSAAAKSTHDEAAVAWNRRVPDPAIEKAREALDMARIPDGEKGAPLALRLNLMITKALALLGEVSDER